MRAIWVLTLSAIALPAFAQFDKDENAALDAVLNLANVQRQDLGWSVGVPGPTTSIAERCLRSPLAGADEVWLLQCKATQGDVLDMLEAAPAMTGPFEPPSVQEIQPHLSSSVPAAVREPAEKLIKAVARANDAVRAALSGLSPAERRALIEGLPQRILGDAQYNLSFVKGLPADPDTLQSIVDRVNLPLLRWAARNLLSEAQKQSDVLAAAAKDTKWAGFDRETVNGLIVEIAGVGNDDHDSNDSMLCIDLGGRNRYSGRYGAGVGYASLVLDLGDRADIEAPDASFGAGLLGVGVALLRGDVAGRAGSISFGCGLAGVGVFSASGGSLRGATMTEGFGGYGVGLCLVGGDSPNVACDGFGQGSAAAGGVGWLGLPGANATVVATGLKPSLADSCAQGYGIGDGAHAGGVGMMALGRSGATLRASSRAQGFGEQGGLGCCTLSTNARGAAADVLQAGSLAQGSAIHHGVGLLYEMGAPSGFTALGGAAFGAATDGSVAIVLNHGGPSVVDAPNPCFSQSESLSLVVDEGSTRWMRAPGTGGDDAARSLALFVAVHPGTETNGTAVDGSAVAQGAKSATLSGWAPAVQDAAPALDLPPAGSAPTPQKADMETLAAAALRFPRGGMEAESALKRLAASGRPAMDWLLANRLGDGGSIPLSLLVAHLGADGGAALESYVGSDATDAVNAALRLLVNSRAPFSGDLSKALARPETRLMALKAVACGRDKRYGAALAAIAAGSDRDATYWALRGLDETSDHAGTGIAATLLSGADWPTRMVAEGLLSKYPLEASAAASLLLQTNDERSMRIAIELLGKTGGSALDVVGAYLTDPRAGVRLTAVEALSGHCPPPLKTTILQLQRDTDPLVRMAARGFDFGA